MVQKYKFAVTVYHESFEFVMKAYERRFPRTEYIPVFLGSEILEESLSEDRSLHRVVRKCSIAIQVPFMIKKIIGIDHGYFIQTNILDMKNRTLTIVGHNETFNSRILVEEQCKYYVHPENPDWTCFEQQASLTIFKFWGFEKNVEKIAVRQYLKNIDKGKEIMHIFIKQLHDEGITSVPVWQSDLCSNKDSNVSINIEECEKYTTLDSEYIRRYIGSLNSMTENCLIELYDSLRPIYHEKLPSYTVLFRFLQVTEMSVGKAKEMIQHSIAWRKANEIDKLYENYIPNPHVVKYFTAAWHGTDLNGAPLLLFSLSRLDVRGLLKSVGEEEMIRHVTFICEETLVRIKTACELPNGSPILGITLLVDIEGLSLKHLWSPWISLLMNVIDLCETNYPHCITNILITRVPNGFPLICTILRSFFDKLVHTKLVIFQSNELSLISQYIQCDNIPKFLGGHSPSPIDCILDNNIVPTELYCNGNSDNILDDDKGNTMETHRGNKLWSTSLYRSVYLNKDNPHEVVFKASSNDVLRWDFDVLKGDIVFTLFFVPISDEDNESIWSKSKRYSFVGISSGMCPLRVLKYSHGLTPILSPIDTRSGCSLQDSLEISSSGFYVLQWSALSNTNFIQSKSKFMYYAEVIKRDDIRGSMTSLTGSFTASSNS